MTSVGAVHEFVDGSARRVDVGGTPVCVVRLDDEWFAIGDVCSHADFSLSDGEVWADDCAVECPKHGAMFSLRTGEPQSLPATQPVPVFAVSIVDDQVMVEPR
jgi:3-phenylpropionate/trans-cinnamate dioxygenase ferredoxin subunit